jgi:hypothetical protein
MGTKELKTQKDWEEKYSLIIFCKELSETTLFSWLQ